MAPNRKYLVASTDFGIPSKHRELKPDDNVPLPKRHHLDIHYKICLNCPLPRCYRDGDRDDAPRREKIKGKQLCPIEIMKKRENDITSSS